MAWKERAMAVCAAVLVVAAGGCRPGAVGEAARPEAPKVQNSLCDSVADFGQPLIVDLKAHERAVYEAVMKDGVAVVRYDCHELHLIKDCKIAGDYGFVGVSPKEEVVRLEGADEIELNLPTFGAKIATEVKRDATLDLGLMLIGMRRTTVDAADRKRLEGSGCEQATHFVRGAFLGAFALKQGSSGSAKAAVEIMGAGASGSSESSKRTENRDGDVQACKHAKPDASAPDPNCSALVRLELTALNVASRDEAGTVDVCPKDLVLVNGKCSHPTNEAAFQCREGQLSECLEQCDHGHAGSCAAASFMYFGNHGVPADPDKAASLAQKACDGGSARGCGNLGHAYDRGEALPRDLAKARELYSKSCEMGWPRGCSNLGVLTEKDGDPATANALYDRACSGGEARACHFLALNVDAGKGIAQDQARAKALFQRACNGKHEDACGLLSSQLLSGSDEERAKGVKGLEASCDKGSASACRFLGSLRLSGTKLPKDPAKAVGNFEKACDGKDLKSCTDAAVLLFTGGEGVTQDAARASRLAKKACEGGEASGCRLAAVGMLEGRGSARDDAQALKVLEKSCADGDGESCAGAGIQYRDGFGTAQNAALAVGFFSKACDASYGYGCSLLAAARYDGIEGSRDYDGARAALGRACSAGYGPACGLANATPRVYAITPHEDPFGSKNTAAGAQPFSSKNTAAGAAYNIDKLTEAAAAPKSTAPGGDAAPTSELEKRRASLRDKFKAKLGSFKACPKDARVYDRVQRVRFRVSTTGKAEVTEPSYSGNDKFDACFAKSVAAIKIAGGQQAMEGQALLRLRQHGESMVMLAIAPDPSELVIPDGVRRMAGCGCAGSDAELVCSLQCRSGGATGSVAGGGNGDTGFGGPKDTAPASVFQGKATKPSSKPFSEKNTKPSKDKFDSKVTAPNF